MAKFATPDAGNLQEIKRHPKASLIFGVLVLILGAAAVLFPFAATLTAEMIIGAILFVAGVFKTVASFSAWRQRSFMLGLLSGLLAMVVGALLLLFPLPGVLSLTMVVAVFLLADGALRFYTGLKKRPENGWVWLLGSGVLALLLGGFILIQWPYAATWLLGLLVGVDLLVTGVHYVWLSLSTDGARPFARRI